MNIPKVQLAFCYYCNEPVDMRSGRTYRFGASWFKARQGAGGVHGTLVQWQEQYACHDCIYKLQHSIPLGQMPLFEMGLDSDA